MMLLVFKNLVHRDSEDNIMALVYHNMESNRLSVSVIFD